MADTQGMASTSTRSLWKGAITFGLAHIPVGERERAVTAAPARKSPKGSSNQGGAGSGTRSTSNTPRARRAA